MANSEIFVIGVIAGFISHEHLQNNPKAILNRLTSNQLSNIVGNLPANTVNQFVNNGFGQTRNSDIPYIGAPDRGWDVQTPNTNGGSTPVVVGDIKLESAEVQNDDTSSISTVNQTASNNTSWESIWYAESTTIVGMYHLPPRKNIKQSPCH
jgi:filamentous hemagglutinin family protein